MAGGGRLRGPATDPVDWRRAPAWPVTRAHLFAYGTLERASVLRDVTGHLFPARSAFLPEYRCFRLAGRPYPGIVACPGAVTRGTLYLDVPASVIESLDQWEDDFYERHVVRVLAAGPATAAAFAYVVPGRRTELITDLPWRRMR